MALVSATEMIKKAYEGHYAVPQFNINNLEWIKAVLEGCEKAQSPVMLGVSEGAGKYMCGFKNVVDMVKNVHDTMGITVPVAIHLDHGTFEGAQKCIEVGFTSVMFDGSHYDFEENVEKSKQIIELAHSKGISVECEVGGIGGTEDGVTSNGELADPEECAKIAALGCDFLAAGIGNIHGVYPANWAGLNFDRLDEINKAVDGKPLVLHGGSGIPFDQVHKAITLGVSKVNVNTELQLVFAKATREYIEAGKDQEGKGFDPRKLLKPGCDAVVNQVIEMCKAFGSADKA
ncbi:MAG: class II fructose-1,6-bisphosphate aldolase [Solobacterium sp.]|nr:class II fructose-1,6-bisphosphate aldolase [Solobacterium sp.]